MSPFIMKLEFTAQAPARLHLRVYDEEHDDILSILDDVCEHVAENVRFVVAGFGQAPWPVDVGTDLPLVLEQLPRVIRKLRCHVAAEIGFYEQGVERIVYFKPAGEELELECKSLTDCAPEPATARMNAKEVRGMLCTLLDDFVRIATGACPGVGEHPWFIDWISAARD